MAEGMEHNSGRAAASDDAAACALPAFSDEDEMDLEAIEAQLTSEVPNLLETMNAASMDVNDMERQVTAAQEQYQHFLLEWSSISEEIKAKHGQAFETARPYFDARRKTRIASQRAQAITQKFSTASAEQKQAKLELRGIEERLAFGAHNVTLDDNQQEALSRATVRALKSQQDRDMWEREYAKVLEEYQTVKDLAAKIRREVGDALILRMAPVARRVQQSQFKLVASKKSIEDLQERLRVAKHAYGSSMNELDRISTAVHVARRDHAKVQKSGIKADHRSLSKVSPEVSPEEDHPLAESAEVFAFGEIPGVHDTPLAKVTSRPGEKTARQQGVPEVTGAEVIADSPFA
mmetsp:Transcript_45947/g.81425  ORF Transcript_45947/g.81425 Transcript_45947/m.81425 type:complete len:349 (+) Transcript_45947:92-1138(+)